MSVCYKGAFAHSINQNSSIALADDMGIEREILEALLKETRISAAVHVGIFICCSLHNA